MTGPTPVLNLRCMLDTMLKKIRLKVIGRFAVIVLELNLVHQGFGLDVSIVKVVHQLLARCINNEQKVNKREISFCAEF